MRPTTSSSWGRKRAARFAHGVLQGIGDACPGPQRGHHQVDGVGQLGFDSCGLAALPDRLQLPCQQADDQPDRDHEGQGPAESEVQEPGRQQTDHPGQEAVPHEVGTGRGNRAPAATARRPRPNFSMRSAGRVARRRAVPPNEAETHRAQAATAPAE